MKKMCLWIMAVLLSLPALSQSQKGFIYLKNGSVLKGKYSRAENDQRVVVLSAGNTWIFDASEIDSISNRRLTDRMTPEFPASDSRFFYRADLGVLAGNSENSQSAPFSFSGSVNYALQAKLSLGLGAGVEFLKESYLPVYTNIEYKFRTLASAPYLFLRLGYQVPIDDANAVYYDVVPLWYDYWPWPQTNVSGELDSRGGVLINPGVGHQWMLSQGFGINFSVGYQFHRLSYSGENDYQLFIDYNRLSIRLGIIFN